MSDVGKGRIAGKARKVVEYKVFNTVDQIGPSLAEGWELYGSPFGSGYLLNQAMVKYEEPEVVKLPVKD